MNNFKGKVAVITGAASGIGRGLAERCAKEGMKVVLADIEEPALREVAQSLPKDVGAVLAAPTDVAKLADIENLAQKTMEAFGAVHLLFNNAGVTGRSRRIWELTMEDWQWELGVNLWGVIHGLKVFIPIMLEQDDDSHIINTASIAGLTCTPTGAYAMAKHGIVGLTESLYFQLQQVKARIGLSLLCPGLVSTRIQDSARNRPADLGNAEGDPAPTAEQQARSDWLRERYRNAMPPAQLADIVLQAIEEERFYIFSQEMYKEDVQLRMESILQETGLQFPKYFP